MALACWSRRSSKSLVTSSQYKLDTTSKKTITKTIAQSECFLPLFVAISGLYHSPRRASMGGLCAALMAGAKLNITPMAIDTPAAIANIGKFITGSKEV